MLYRDVAKQALKIAQEVRWVHLWVELAMASGSVKSFTLAPPLKSGKQWAYIGRISNADDVDAISEAVEFITEMHQSFLTTP